MKIKTFKNGSVVTFEKSFPSGMYCVLLRDPSGEVADKIRLDDYESARAYFKAFCNVAKNINAGS